MNVQDAMYVRKYLYYKEDSVMSTKSDYGFKDTVQNVLNANANAKAAEEANNLMKATAITSGVISITSVLYGIFTKLSAKHDIENSKNEVIKLSETVKSLHDQVDELKNSISELRSELEGDFDDV